MIQNSNKNDESKIIQKQQRNKQIRQQPKTTLDFTHRENVVVFLMAQSATKANICGTFPCGHLCIISQSKNQRTNTFPKK